MQGVIHNKLDSAIWGRPNNQNTDFGGSSVGGFIGGGGNGFSYGVSLTFGVSFDSKLGLSPNVSLSGYAGINSSQTGSLSGAGMVYGDVTFGSQRAYDEQGAYGFNGSIGLLASAGFGAGNSAGTFILGRGYNFNSIAPEVNNFTWTLGGSGAVGAGLLGAAAVLTASIGNHGWDGKLFREQEGCFD